MTEGPSIEVWRREALCFKAPDEDKRVFLPWGTRDGRVRTSDIERVKEDYCNRCPVQEDCLNFAAETESLGIWGGINFTWSKCHSIHVLKKDLGRITIDMVLNHLEEEKNNGTDGAAKSGYG